jgi:hypothetical protein
LEIVVASSFAQYNVGLVVDLKIEIDMIKKQVTYSCLNFPEKKPIVSDISYLNYLEDGVRFSVSICYKDEYFEVKRMRII